MFEEMYQSVKLRFGTVDASQSMGDWICNNTTIRRRPMSFEGYDFQRAIADDMHPDMSVKKCSQIGLTEIQIRKFLAILTRSTALSGIFSLPNEKMFTKVYNGRIKPILEADEIFNPPSAHKPTRSKDQIQIRDSFGYITSCTESDATSISADFLFHDELDLSPQEIIALYQSRLQGSDMQVTQAFSTPTFANYGIDKRYKLTDQREYFAKCDACGHHQIPLFTPRFIHLEGGLPADVEKFTDLTADQVSILNLENCYVRCEKCSRPLNLGNASLREWVARHPLRLNYRGYQVRPFSTPRIKPGYIFSQLGKYLSDGFIRGFYNTVLGEEYTSADAQVQREDIEACMAAGTPLIPQVSKDVPVYLGVDVGLLCHLTLSYDEPDGKAVFFLFETVPAAFLAQRIDELRGIYNIVQGALDRFPYTTQANDIRDATNGLVIPIQYRGGNALQPIFEPDTKILSHYSASNTLVLDRLHSAISHRHLVISGYQGQRETVINHLTDMIRDESPDSEATWKKNTGVDHYFHSMAFNLLARRVADHMFSQTVATIATTSSFMGASFGSKSGEQLLMQPGGSMKTLDRISRLG